MLYAGTKVGNVFTSEDSGRSWTAAARGLDGEVTAIAVSADGAVYAGTSPTSRAGGVEVGGGEVYRSIDGRAPWRHGHAGLTGWHLAVLAADPTRPGRVLTATEHGIFITRDGGSSWAEWINGLVASDLTGLAVDAANPRVAFAAFKRGIAVSRDGGRTWHTALDVRGKRIDVGPLLAVPGTPTTIYAVTSSHAAPKARWTLPASRDAGRTWATAGALPAPIGALIADPSRPATLYAIRGSPQLAAGDIFKSVDGGRSWRQIYSAAGKPSAWALTVDPHDPDVLYAALISPGKDLHGTLLKSENGGRTWRRLRDFGAAQIIRALAADPRRRGTLYAIRGGWTSTVDVSRDGGSTWARLGRSPVDATSLLVDPVRPVVYTGTQNGVYLNTGGSTQWHAAGPAGSDVRWLAIDANAKRLYAGIAEGGAAATPLPLTVR